MPPCRFLRGRVILWFIALCSYAMYGYAKFQPVSSIPLLTSIVIDLLLLVIFAGIFFQYKRARYVVRRRHHSQRGVVTPSGDGILDASDSQTAPLLSDCASPQDPAAGEDPARSRRLAKQLDALSTRALFFAGFAYYAVSARPPYAYSSLLPGRSLCTSLYLRDAAPWASLRPCICQSPLYPQVDFFYEPTSAFAGPYLTLMSISFGGGLLVVVTNVVVQVRRGRRMEGRGV
jgi:hypothetical protein